MSASRGDNAPVTVSETSLLRIFRAVTARRSRFVRFVYTKWAQESVLAYRSLSANQGGVHTAR